MLTTAMRHQAMAVEKLDRLKVGALLMEMGTGKGRCFMELGERKVSAGKAARCVTLCPVSGKGHLADDTLKHTGHVPAVHGDGYTTPAARHNIVGIESLSTSINAYNRLAELAQDAVVVIDESQLIKNRNTARTRHIMEATRGARYRYISSGLAMPNGVEDMWSQMQWLSPLILGYKSYSEFARFHLKHEGDAWGSYGQGRIIGRFNTDVIAAKIAPYAFEARKSDCLDLPPKTYSYRTATLGDAARHVYAEAKRRILMGRSAFDVDDATIYRLFTALQMISSGIVPRWLFKDGEIDDLPNAKLDLLANVMAEANGKSVVWCKYLAEADAIESTIRATGRSCVRIDGSVTLRERSERLRRFREDTDVLVSTLQVGGMVHDWGFADTAIYTSNSFDYMLRAQSEDRTHRAMMTGKAHYIDLRGDTGIERRIARSLNKKEHALKAFQDKIRQLRNQGTKAARDTIIEEVETL